MSPATPFLRWTIAGCLALSVNFVMDAIQCLAQYEPVQLHALSRSGGQAGTRFELNVASGSQLAEIDALYFSNPQISAEVIKLDPLPFTEQPVPRHGHFLVNLPADLAPGRYEVRVAGRHGISNPRAFLVSGLENEPPTQVSHDATSPTPLEIGTLLHARSTNAEVDYFLIRISKGQPLQMELLAQQLDSRMIGQLKLFDANGRQVGASRGSDDVDPVLLTDVDLEAGNYLLAVQDFLYRGGDEYHYQLVARPKEQAISLVKRRPAAEGTLPSHWLTRSFAVDDICLEKAASQQADQSDSQLAQSIELPFTSTQIFSDQQADSLFQFHANEGELLAMEVISQRAGQPTDARLMVQRIEMQDGGPAKLHEVLNIDDCQSLSDGAINLVSTDPVALLKVPATADYQLAVRDLDVGQSLSEWQSFCLSVGPPQPGFDLIAYRVFPQSDVNQTQPFGSKLCRGGTELIRVFVVRRDGWNGAVNVRCEGLPEGVSAGQVVIAANQSQTQLAITANETASAATTPIRVIGESVDGLIKEQAIAATIQWGKGAARDFIQSRITSSLWIFVSEQDMSPISITLGDDTIPEVKKGESVKMPVKLVRREGGQGVVVVRPRDLPAGIKSGDLTIAAENSEGEMEFRIEPSTAPGTYSLWLQCETKIKWKSNPQGLERAQQHRSLLQTLHDDPAQAANLEAIQAAIAEAAKRIDAATGEAKEKELNVFIPTSNATIRVVEP